MLLMQAGDSFTDVLRERRVYDELRGLLHLGLPYACTPKQTL